MDLFRFIKETGTQMVGTGKAEAAQTAHDAERPKQPATKTIADNKPMLTDPDKSYPGQMLRILAA